MRRILLLLSAVILLLPLSCARRGCTSVDMDRLSLIDSVVYASIENGDIPGAVVGIVHDGKLVYKKAYGSKRLVPYEEAMTTETMFDLASVSKCVGTTIAIMQLAERGIIRLTDQVRYYIPEFQPWKEPKTGVKDHITIQDLLTHSSGLDPFLRDVPKYVEIYGAGTPDSLVNYIATKSQRNFKPGTDVMYSCLNFIILQNILERVTGERLCDYAQKNIFDALDLKHTTYFPVYSPAHPELAELCAPTEMLGDSTVLQAQVHDPTARIVNLGNSGNAGVFSDVEDLAVICNALMNGGEWNGHRILSPLAVNRMFTIPADNDPKVARSLGWDTYDLSPYLCGDIFNASTCRGHTGYTGTSVLMDLETSTAVIILSNRVHPTDTGSIVRMRSKIASITASAICLRGAK